jgi:hypothetical protein
LSGNADIDENAQQISSYMATSKAVLSFGTIFTPMSSARTSFDRMLDDISRRHRSFAKAQRDADGQHSPAANSLSFWRPAFAVETKLDGGRMIVHISRDGVVKIQARSGNWYR